MSDFKPQPETPEVNLVPLDLQVSTESEGLKIDGEPKTNVKNVVNTTTINKVQLSGNILASGGGSIVKGFIKSANYRSLEAGWAINGDTGDAEFNGNVIAGSYTQVFRQASIPTSLHINDIWIDTDDSNKMYVAESVGADQIAAGEWVLSTSAAAWSTLTDDDGHKPADDADVTLTQMSSGDVKVISQKFTAGEDLTAHKFVCFKVGSNSQILNATQDSYVRQFNPDSNYGTEELYIGSVDGALQDNSREAYVKFASLPANIATCSFNLINYQNLSSDLEISLYTLDADFDETTITWNNAPASTLIAGSAKTITTEGTITWDITSTILGIQRTGGTFYGLAIKVTGGSVNQWFRAGSTEVETVSYLSITQEGTNGKVYLADRDSYALSRFVIGKTLAAADADATVNVQIAGIMSDLSFSSSYVGYPAMLTDSGAAGMTSLPRIIDKDKRNVELGMILSTTEIMFNVNRGSDFYISSETPTLTGSTTTYTVNVYPPLFARHARIEYYGVNSGGVLQGLTSVFKDSNQVQKEYSPKVGELQLNWSSTINKIVITFTGEANWNITPTATVWYYE